MVVVSIKEYERPKGFDRRAMRLDEMNDAQIEEMVAVAIPPVLRYGLDDIPDRP